MSGPAAVPCAARRPLRVLLLFEKEWDADGLRELAAAGAIEPIAAGFDLFRFPSNARLLTFDAARCADRLVARYRGRVDAVVSNNEQFGALLAAVVARRLGLPGADPAAVARAQHKLAARRAAQAAVPAAGVAGSVLPYALHDRRLRDPAALAAAVAALGLRFPLFVKPVKATFSVLARRVDDAAALAAHLRFGRLERGLIERLVAPYAQLAATWLDLPCPPARLLLEPPLHGRQINVDGHVYRGAVRVHGIVDACMYPGEQAGARHFLRFAYPSRLAPAQQAQVHELARQIVAAIGYDHGLFNLECFVTDDGSVHFIEMNPRMASQLAGLYRAVDGLDSYAMLIALAAGRDPQTVARRPPTAGAAASVVFRRFDGAAAPAPRAGALPWLAQCYPDARLQRFAKRGRGLAREYRWLGSHRYAVLNLAAADAAALERDIAAICARFDWPYQPLEEDGARAVTPHRS